MEPSLIILINYINLIFNLQVSYNKIDEEITCQLYLHSYISQKHLRPILCIRFHKKLTELLTITLTLQEYYWIVE